MTDREPGRDRLSARPAHRIGSRVRDRFRRDERWLLAAVVAAITAMSTAYFLLPLDRLGPQRPVLSWTLLVLALGAVALLLLRQTNDVLTDRPGTRPGVMIPLLMYTSVLVFAGAYYVLATQSGEFTGLGTRIDALYFTVVTLATVGYGDITATGQSARVLTILQILYTFVFLTAAATAFSRRVRGVLALRHRHPDAPRPTESDRNEEE